MGPLSRFSLVVVTLVAALGVLWSVAARAVSDPTPGGVSANTLKMPTGPGSLEGLGKAGEVSVFTGQYSYSIPLDLPAGQAGFGPSLALAYSGDTGQSVMGIGWGFSPPHIQRSTRHGIPRYDETDELEVLGLGGGGRLVRVESGVFSGEWRVEGQGHAIRVQALAYPEDGFLATTTDGTTWKFDARIAGPPPGPDEDPTTFAWYVSRVTALGGRHLDFHYSDPTDVAGSLGHRLLTRLTWGPLDGGVAVFEANFIHGLRLDRSESYRAGFWRVLRHRLERVEINAFGSRRKTYVLSYDDGLALSRLSAIEITGAGTTPEALPTTSFLYGDFAAAPTVNMAENTGGWRLDQRGVTLQDADQDGLVDLVRIWRGEKSFRRNRGGVFDGPVAFEGGAELDLSEVRMMDLDGNLVPELVTIANDTWRVYDQVRDVSGPEPSYRWAFREEWAGSFGVPLHSAGQQFGDVDGDGRTDILDHVTSGLRLWRGSDEALGTVEARPHLSESDGFLELEDVELHDVNGDGLADAVWLADKWVKVYWGLGDGTFETRSTRYCYPWNTGTTVGPTVGEYSACNLLTGDVVERSNIKLADLDRDGQLDIVRVSGGHVYWWPGYWFADAARGSSPWGPSRQVPRPPLTTWDDTVTFADLNGNGSVDVVWSSAHGLFYLDLAGAATRGMLVEIDNGLGQKTEIGYSTTALLQVAAEESGDPWSAPFPVNMTVPFEVTTRVPADPDHPVMTARMVVRDGFWDVEERRFGGFLEATEVTVADEESPEEALIVTTEFERGDGVRRVLRGRPVRVVRGDGTESSNLFDIVDTNTDALAVTNLPSTEPLFRVPVTTEVFTHTYEKTCEPRFTKTTYAFDGYGQVTQETKWGEVDEVGANIVGDEVVTATSYRSDFSSWILFKPCRLTTQELDGTVRDRKVMVYEPYEAPDWRQNCVGGAYDGRVRGTYGLLNLPGGGFDRFVQLSAADYDSVGNPTVVIEAEVERQIEYDTWQLYPVRESLPDAPTVALAWEISEWDLVLGVPREMAGADGRVRAVEYDSLGRPVSGLADADGDSVLDVLVGYEYELVEAAPWPRITTTTYEGGAIPDVVSVAVHTAGGAPLYSAVAEGGSSWVVSGHRYRNRLGLTTQMARPYRVSGALPTSFPASGDFETIGYDAQGRVISQELPAFSRAVALSGSTSPTGAKTMAPVVRTTAYAPFQTTVTSPDLADVVTEVDGLGRLVAMQRTVGVVERSTATWDAAGRMTAWVVDAAASAGAPISHTFGYDTLGRLVEADDPDAGLRVHTWTDGGRLATTENAVGNEVFYGYDTVGRLVSRQGVSADYDETWEFRYDWNPLVDSDPNDVPSNWGHLMAIEGPGSDYDWMALDSLGRVARTVRQIESAGGSKRTADLRTEFSWSGKPLVNRVLNEKENERIRVEQDYDPVGRLRWMGYGVEGNGPSLLWEAVDVLPSGAASYEHLGNGLSTQFGRDALDQVADVRVAALGVNPSVWDRAVHAVDASEHAAHHTRVSAVATADIRYDVKAIVRNAYGAIRGAQDSGEAPGARDRSAVFDYDLGRRLIGAEVAGHTFEYEYDARQNLTRRNMSKPSAAPTPDIATGVYVYGGAGFGPRQLANVGTAVFSYDAAGRTDTITDADYTRNWYDAFDRLRRVGLNSTDYTYHRYDAGGERVSSTWPAGRVEFYFGGGLTERDERWELMVGLGGARQVARINVHKEAGYPLSGPEEVVYLHQGLGHGPSLLTDMSGGVLEERHFEPYGAPLWGDTDYEAERVGWNGKPVDPDRGWSDHGARWHATRFARWLSVDPPLKGPAGWAEHGLAATPFGFVAGNPVLLWDPDGREPLNPDNVSIATMHLTFVASRLAMDPGRFDSRKSAHYQPNLPPTLDVALWEGKREPLVAGTITYGALDEKGRPTGTNSFRIRPDKSWSRRIVRGKDTDFDIKPPGLTPQYENPLYTHTRGHLEPAKDGGSGAEARNLVTLYQKANSLAAKRIEAGLYSDRPIAFVAITPIYLREESMIPEGVLYERITLEPTSDGWKVREDAWLLINSTNPAVINIRSSKN